MSKLNKPSWHVCCLGAIGVVVIGILEWLALEHGIDGIALGGSIAAIVAIIAGIAGFTIGRSSSRGK